MRVYDLKDKSGRIFAFEVDNFWLGRGGVATVVQTIPGASFRRAIPAGYADEQFCEFELDGARFVAWEPFGDNSRYWIGPKPPIFSENVDVVRDAFIAYEPRKWFSTIRAVAVGLVVVGVVLMLAQVAFGMNEHAAQWGKRLAGSGAILSVTLFVAARAGLVWHVQR